VSSPNLLQVVSTPRAHLSCHGYAIAAIISSARPETDPSSKVASLLAENTHPRRLTYVSSWPSAPPNTSSKASNSVGEGSALRLLASLAR
jgi:hypothetical protein